MKTLEDEVVRTSLYSYWTLHPESECWTCEMITNSDDMRLVAILDVPTLDMEIAYHAARCDTCQQRLAKIVDVQLPTDWKSKSIVERLAEFRRRIGATGHRFRIEQI